MKDWPTHKKTCSKDPPAAAASPAPARAAADAPSGPPTRVLTKESLHAMLDSMPLPLAAQQVMMAVTHVPPALAATLSGRDKPPVVGMDLLINVLTHGRAVDIVTCSEGMNSSVFEAMCARGNETAVRMILSRCPADRMSSLVNVRDPRARGTPLMAAVANGRDDVVAHLLATRAVHVNAACERVPGNDASAGMVGCTALHFAAQARKRGSGILAALLDAGADVNATDHAGVTPLMFACTMPGGPAAWGISMPDRAAMLDDAQPPPARVPVHGVDSIITSTVLDADVVECVREVVHAHGGEESGAAAALLLSRGADVHARTSQGRTAIDYAVEGGNVAAYAVCACAGADVTPVVSEETQITYVHMAVHKDAVGILRCAHALGVDVDISDAQGRSPFTHACALDARACVRTYVDWGDHMEDVQPLLSAVTMDRLDIAQYLLQKGIAHEGAGIQELPLLMYALQRCADAGAPAGRQSTPRDWRKLTRALLAAGARVDDMEGVSKWTAMHMAVACASADIVSHMWTCTGADACINALTSRGKYSRVLVQPRSTVLHVAVARGDMAVLKAVCEGPHASKLKRNAQDEEGNTALHIAARELCADVALYLITPQKEGGVGVDAGLRNSEGCTALQLFDRAYSLRDAGSLVRMMSSQATSAATDATGGEAAASTSGGDKPKGADADPEVLLKAREALAAATASRARSICSSCSSCVVM